MRLKMYRGVWCAYWKEGKLSKRKSSGTSDRDIAEQWFRDFQKSLVNTETIADVFKEYLKEKPGEKLTWKALKPFWANYRPDQITREACRKYIESRDDLQPGSIRRHLEILRAAVNFVKPGSGAKFHLPPKPPPKERYLTREEFNKLLANAESIHVKVFLVLAVGTAARVSALLDLEWNQVDFEREIITLSKGNEAKNKRRATVPMTDSVRDILEQIYEVRTCNHVIEYGGGPIKNISKGVKEAAKRAGLEEVSPHVLRHTAAVWMAENRIPMSEISQYLGHTSTDVTERVYARYSPDYLRTSANSLDVGRVQLGIQRTSARKKKQPVSH